MNDVTIGQYIPGKSILHRMDPRLKLCMTIFLIVLIFVAKNFLSLGITVGAVIICMVLSQVSVRLYFKSLKPIWFILIFTGILQLFYGSGEPLIKVFMFTITKSGVFNSIFISLRIMTLVLVSAVLTFTTTPSKLADAIEALLKPLAKIRVPVHDFAMMMTIALRFIPLLLEETQKIMQAQKARGADMESGGLIQRVKALIPVLIPLFVSAFRRAYDLGTAMESRCYQGGEGRTKMNVLHLEKLDYYILLISVVFFGSYLMLNILLPVVLQIP